MRGKNPIPLEINFKKIPHEILLAFTFVNERIVYRSRRTYKREKKKKNSNVAEREREAPGTEILLVSLDWFGTELKLRLWW